MRFKHTEEQLAWWLEDLAQYNMEIVNQPCKKHTNADGMSRLRDVIPECDFYNTGERIEDIPCEGCLQMIRCCIDKNNRTWDRALPLLAMALHSTIHRQTGYTPNRLMLGREVIQPVHLLIRNIPDCLHSQEPSEWCFDLANRLSKAHLHARQNLQEAQLRQKRDYDMRLVEHYYNPGDIVYKLDSITKVGQSSKLRPPWTGPYLVISCNAPLNTIRDQKKEQVLHHNRLKLPVKIKIFLCSCIDYAIDIFRMSSKTLLWMI